MRFIHTSDWHLGRQFHNISLLEDQRIVLTQIVNYVEQQSVDAVIIAGDVFDRSVPPAAAVELLDEILDKLCSQLKIPVILIPGNHDSAERLRFGARQLKQSGLHIIGSLGQIEQPVTLSGKRSGTQDEINFYGIPYADPESVRHYFNIKVSTYDEAQTFLTEKIHKVMSEEKANVLISHCYLDGALTSESERPLSIGGCDRVSYEPFLKFDYVALGHLHSPQYKGAKHIRYSGSILKYSFSEQRQEKGVTLVEFNGKYIQSIQNLPLRPLRDTRVIEGRMADVISKSKLDPNADDYLLIRLTDNHAILDAMGKLREVYPNVLHLEKPGIMRQLNKQGLHKDNIRQNELDMFRDFFFQVMGEELTSKQDEALKLTIETMRNKGEL